MWWFFMLEIICLAVVVTLVLNIYVSIKYISWCVYVAAWLGWFMSFAIVILVPLDILASDYTSCMTEMNANTTIISTSDASNIVNSNSNSNGLTCSQPMAYLEANERMVLWRILYWSSFVLTWFIYPYLRSYSTTGHFKMVDRVREALLNNIVALAIIFVICIFAFFYLVAIKQVDGHSLVGMAMAASNAWGMLLLVTLMGYGLVEIPRSIWRRANRSLMLKYLKYQMTTLQHGKLEAREFLSSTLKQVRKASDQMPTHNPMRGYLDTIVSECPSDEYNSIKQQSNKTSDVSYGKLVKLHVQIKKAKHNLRHAEAMYSEKLKTAFDLEDIVISTKHGREKYITWSFQPPRKYQFAETINYFEWVWYSYLDLGYFYYVLQVPY